MILNPFHNLKIDCSFGTFYEEFLSEMKHTYFDFYQKKSKILIGVVTVKKTQHYK